MSATDALWTLLDDYVDPAIGQSLVSAGAVTEARLEGGLAMVRLQLGFPAAGYSHALRRELGELIAERLGARLELDVSWKVASSVARAGLESMPNVRNIIAVASGKGGVGKSTVAVNLALALRDEGARVGILDADIYGPSQPRMLGASGEPEASGQGRGVRPVVAHGLQSMSIGYMIDDSQPMIWRGPMATQALTQLLGETAWDDLDYLILDLPPGTGDIQLTLSQRVPLSGAVLVTTPQDIALLDARKGAEMFRKVSVPVLGVVENMSVFCCPNCGHETSIFGEGGGEKLAAEAGVEVLGQLPLELRIRELADTGKPTVVGDPNSDTAARYRAIAVRAVARLAYQSVGSFPSIEVTDD